MSKTKIIITGIATIALIFAALSVATGTETTAAVEAVAETTDGSAVADVLNGIVNLLPWPWNAVGAAVLTAAGAVFAWKRGKKKETANKHK